MKYLRVNKLELRRVLGELQAIAKQHLFFANHFLAYYAKLYNRAERFESKKVESR